MNIFSCRGKSVAYGVFLCGIISTFICTPITATRVSWPEASFRTGFPGAFLKSGSPVHNESSGRKNPIFLTSRVPSSSKFYRPLSVATPPLPSSKRVSARAAKLNDIITGANLAMFVSDNILKWVRDSPQASWLKDCVSRVDPLRELMSSSATTPLIRMFGRNDGILAKTKRPMYSSYRFLTAGLLHNSLMHLYANSQSISFIAPLAQQYYGLKKSLAIYFLSSVLANLISHKVWRASVDKRGAADSTEAHGADQSQQLRISENTISVGASGGVLGLLGATCLHLFRFRALLDPTYLRHALLRLGSPIFLDAALVALHNMKFSNLEQFIENNNVLVDNMLPYIVGSIAPGIWKPGTSFSPLSKAPVSPRKAPVRLKSASPDLPIDYPAHLGGAFGGVVVGGLLGDGLKVKGFVAQKQPSILSRLVTNFSKMCKTLNKSSNTSVSLLKKIWIPAKGTTSPLHNFKFGKATKKSLNIFRLN